MQENQRNRNQNQYRNSAPNPCAGDLVHFELWTHFSGRHSSTQALLVLDPVGGAAMEMSAEDCEWRKHGSSMPADWELFEAGSGFSGRNNATHFHLHDLGKGVRRLDLTARTAAGHPKLASIKVSCKPHHVINTKVIMHRPTGLGSMSGVLMQKVAANPKELPRHEQRGRVGVSILAVQSSTFATQKNWDELGGSSKTVAYLSKKDEERQSASFLEMGLDKETAENICRKHLGEAGGDLLSDCIFDVSTSGDESFAEVAAMMP